MKLIQELLQLREAGIFRVIDEDQKGHIFFEGSKEQCEQWIEEMSDSSKYKDLSLVVAPK